ncbi:MAG: hypothetical protein A2511_05265 [Deltaproteobacteria bacterium RIFOXYD12_FULL_50_9]|nr:MAG: hypothetical protein A2511_05265 [Deltaproteobacteria bacterium RIFOXYD12_FULL_50_9]
MASILIVEDDEGMLKSIQRALIFEGHTIIGAENGLVALHLLKKTSVDLVITDIFMPHMDGIETITEIKSLYPEIKIITISGGGSVDGVDYLDLAAMMGADCTFLKPFDQKDLLSAVAELLS